MASTNAPRLLIVDDEVRILSALRRSLRRDGYEIQVAESAAAALAILRDGPVDLLLSDHKMPGMGGIELCREAERLQPGLPKILITGWIQEVSPADLEAIGVRAVLPKPWEDDDLKSTLRAVLEQAGAPPRG